MGPQQTPGAAYVSAAAFDARALLLAVLLAAASILHL